MTDEPKEPSISLTIPPNATPEVQVEILRTFRSMQRWSAIKVVVGTMASLGFFAVTCWATCH